MYQGLAADVIDGGGDDLIQVGMVEILLMVG